MRALLLMFMLCMVMAAQAGDVTITWTTPTERADGTELSPDEIDHYNLYADGALFGTLAGGMNETFSGTMTPGLHCLAMETVDTGSRVSVFSNEVCKTVTSDSQPNSVTITVTVAP